MSEQNGEFPKTQNAEYAERTGETVTGQRTVNTKYGPKAVLALESGTEFWSTPYMNRQLGLAPDPPSAKRPTARVNLPAKIERFGSSYGRDGFKLVPL